MALFDLHKKCARCCEKGVGDKKDCDICSSLTAEQKQQLATPTYKSHKDRSKKMVTPP